MNHENLLPCLEFRESNFDHSVESAWPSQRWIQDVFSVCCCEDDHCFTCWKSIHLDEHLVQGWVFLLISWCFSLFADRVNFINENDWRSLLPGFSKQLSNTWCTETDKHFDKLRTRDIKERSSRLSCTSFGKHSFTSTWWTCEQGTFGYFSTHFNILVAIF